MTVHVEKDTVITVPSLELGSEKAQRIELREADRPRSVAIQASRHGDEVGIEALREALDKAESEFCR